MSPHRARPEARSTIRRPAAWIETLLRLDADPQTAGDGAGRLAFVMIVPWVAAPVLGFYAIDAFLNGGDRAWVGGLHASVALLFLVAGIVVRLRPRTTIVTWSARLALAATMLLFLGVFLFLRDGLSLLWIGVLPITSFFVLGLREGLGWCVVTLLTWLFLLEQPDLFGGYSGDARWPTRDESRDFGVAFLFITIISFVYELLRLQTRKRLIEQSESLQQTSRLESIGRLTSGVAHDFNNLLMVIIGNLELIALDAQRSGRPLPGLDQARSASDRAADLTGKLLSFARRQPLSPESLDVEALFAGLRPLLASSLGETVAIATGLADTPLYCRADRGQLENALLNLAINARDAMTEGGELTLVAQRMRITAAGDGALVPGDYVRIAVTDDGPGIPPEVRERVFEPFFTTKELGAGTGLGLSMVEGFLRQSGGEVRIRDARPERTARPGTTVELYLPAAEPPALRAESPSSSSRS